MQSSIAMYPSHRFRLALYGLLVVGVIAGISGYVLFAKQQRPAVVEPKPEVAVPQEQMALQAFRTPPEVCQKYFIEGGAIYKNDDAFTAPMTCSFALGAEGPTVEFHIATSGELSVYNGTTKIFSSAAARDDKGELINMAIWMDSTDSDLPKPLFNAVMLQDITYDGYLDLTFSPYLGASSRLSYFFSFDPKLGMFATSSLLSLNLAQVDTAARTIESYEKSSTGLESSEKLYRFENGAYVLAREVVQEFYYRYPHLKSHENDIVRIVRERRGDKLVEIERAYASADDPNEGLVWVASYDLLPNSYEKGIQKYLANNTSDFDTPDYQDYLRRYAITALLDYHRGDDEINQESIFCEISEGICYDGVSLEFARYGSDIVLIVTNGSMSGVYNLYQGVYIITVVGDLLRFSPFRVIDTTISDISIVTAELGGEGLRSDGVWQPEQRGVSFRGHLPFGSYPCAGASHFEIYQDKLILASKSIARGCRAADGTPISIDTPADVPENFDRTQVETWRADPAVIEKAKTL